MTKRLKQIGTRSNPMRVDLFDYDLPPERIALRPPSRARPPGCCMSRLHGPFQDLAVADLPSLIRSGDALVVNDTRVIAARLDGVRVRGAAAARIEATLIKRLDDNRWRALVGPPRS